MRFRSKLIGLLAVLVAAASFVVVPLAAAAPPHEGVTICHRTGAANNPFVAITTDNDATIAAHVGTATNPPHPHKDSRVDFLLPFPGGTVDDCKDADPDPK